MRAPNPTPTRTNKLLKKILFIFVRNHLFWFGGFFKGPVNIISSAPLCSILKNNLNQYCLYYKSNVDVKIEIENLFNDIHTHTLNKNVYKFCFDISATTIKVVVDQDVVVYFGRKYVQTDKRKFNVDFNSEESNYTNEFFTVLKFNQSESVDFGFVPCKKTFSPPIKFTKKIPPLMAIQSKVHELPKKVVCTIIGYNQEYALLNFLNIDQFVPDTKIEIIKNQNSLVEIDVKNIPILINDSSSIDKHVIQIDPNKSKINNHFFLHNIY